MTLEVVGLGALNMDKLYRVDKIAEKGEEVFIRKYLEEAGGSAANSIVGLARLGRRVGYLGKVGSDPEGRFLLKNLEDENVQTGGIIVSKKGRSGIVIGFIDRTGDRVLYVYPGVNDTLSLEELNKSYIKNPKFLHLSSFVGNKPFEAQKKLLQTLRDVRVSFDPGDLYARRGLAALKPIFKHCYVVFPNERELRLITGKGCEEGSKVLIGEGANIVVIKLGEKGCYISDGQEKFLVKAFKVRVIDTTGAGDAFCAGFLHGLLSGKDLYTCGKLANFVASRKIKKDGARKGLPKLSDLPKILR